MVRAESSPARERLARKARVRGVALVVAMLMMAVIGVLSVALARNAIGSRRIASGSRLQVQASQLAQQALHHCEGQLALAPASAALPSAGASAVPGWAVPAHWAGKGPAMGPAMASTLSATDFSGARPPRVFPQCLAESTATPGVFIVTARGFSDDFAVDPASGAVLAGAVAWMQSTVLVAPTCRAGCPQAVRQLAWEQLLTPPF